MESKQDLAPQNSEPTSKMAATFEVHSGFVQLSLTIRGREEYLHEIKNYFRFSTGSTSRSVGPEYN